MPIFQKISFASILVLLSMTVTSAHAGFEWRPPEDVNVQTNDSVILDESTNIIDTRTPVLVDRAPLPILNQDIEPPRTITAPKQPPVITVEDTSISSQPISLTGSDFSQPVVEFEPVSAPTVSAPIINAEQFSTPIPPKPMAVVDGFGREVPLVVAVRQVVPLEYEFYFNSDIETNSLVSWQGGREWDKVLIEALNPLNLTFSIINDAVSVHPIGAVSDLQALSLKVPVAAKQSIQPIEQEIEPVIDQSIFAQDASELKHKVVDANVVDDLKPIAFQKPKEQQQITYTVWSGSKGETLRTILKKWSDRQGVDLYWNSEFDYPLQATIVVEGTFEDAVKKILEGFDQAQPRPLGRLHRNNQEQHAVLVVEANGLIR